MKKLLGLMAIAPMGLAACGGSDAPSYGEPTNDDYQKMVQEVSLAEVGLGSKGSCDHLLDDGDVSTCQGSFEGFRIPEMADLSIKLEFADWKTHAEDTNGVVKVDVKTSITFEWNGTIDSPVDEGTETASGTYEFKKNTAGDWKIAVKPSDA